MQGQLMLQSGDGISKDGKGLALNSKYVDSVRSAMRIRGSVLVNTLPIAITSAVVGVLSGLVRQNLLPGVESWWAASIEHPLAVQIFGIMFSFLITNRVSAAIGRWWDGMSTVSHMLLKWYDSEIFILSYLKKDMRLLLLEKARKDLDDETRQLLGSRIQQLCELRNKLIHWFSLLNAISLATLKHGEADCMNHISCKIVDFDWLRNADMKQHRGACKMDALRGEFQSGLKNSQVLSYIGMISAEEHTELSLVEEKAAVVVQWITEAMVFADVENLLNIPPPLAGRAHMRMADAMEAFNDAYRIAAVPYPFALAQMVSVLMHFFIVLMPVVIEKFTQAWILTPLLSFMITLSVWGLNSVAMELENPFGDDVNDLPLKELCEAYLEKVMDNCRVSQNDLHTVDGTDSVHTYSALYVDGGNLPGSGPGPALSTLVSQKLAQRSSSKPPSAATGKAPDEVKAPADSEKNSQKPSPPSASASFFVNPSSNVVDELSDGRKLVPCARPRPKRCRSANAGGAYSNRPYTRVVVQRPWSQQPHCAMHDPHHGSAIYGQPMYCQPEYRMRPPTHQWLIDRAASKNQPEPVLQATVVKKQPQPRRDGPVVGTEVDGPEAAAGLAPELEFEDRDWYQPQKHGEDEKGQEDPGSLMVSHGPQPALRPHSHPHVFVRPSSAPYRTTFGDGYGSEDVYAYEEEYDDTSGAHEGYSVIPHSYPGPPAHVPLQPRYEYRSHPHHPQHSYEYDVPPEAVHAGDGHFYVISADELC